jgi:isopenicillin-N N-acyltransferase like protein
VTIPLHISSELRPSDRGLGFGRAQAERVARTVAAYRLLFEHTQQLSAGDVRTIGEAVGAVLVRRWPHLLEEIQGIAQGSGQDESELIAINARTEVLSGSHHPECSVVAVLPSRFEDQAVLLGQNWDWHSCSRGTLVAWLIRAHEDEWYATVTEAGILAKIGFNSRGLGCCLNILVTTLDGDVVSCPIHLLLRRLLQECSTVSEAIAMLAGETASASSAVTLTQAGPRPEAVSVELSPYGAKLAYPDSGGYLLHTNHFVVSPVSEADIALESPGSRERLKEMQGWASGLERAVGIEGLQSILQSHRSKPTAICRHADPSLPTIERTETLASILMDLSTLTLIATDGSPCTAAYERLIGPDSHGT